VWSHFRHCSGTLLKPVLLFALKCESSTFFTSVAVIFAVSRSSGILKESTGRSLL
jgi:hypothetical protein